MNELNRRIRKKKGILKTSEEQKLKELIKREIELEASVLERRAELVLLPGEKKAEV